MLAHLQPTVVRSAAGVLDAMRVWRAEALNDDKVFNRTLRGDVGDLCVDILLDSSTSQTQRQETVSAQGYMIAESLTRCGIPVRVTAFCSLSGYTIMTRFRDYQETKRNENIFHYFTTGCNRDGLAVRALGRELDNAPCEHRLVIILSDAKPNDVIKIARGSSYLDYAEQTGVLDTAREVRVITRTGAAVICVFTGDDEDLPSARTIYGRNFTRIRQLDQFADTVGSLIQNQIRNL
jgi:nitric oxide reductase activation protein